MPSSHDVDDYLVSNGDHITKTDDFISLPMTVVVWTVLVLAGYLVIKYFSRRRKEAVYKKAIKDIYDA
jgi:heme/copper-type cytochrome/quinol oxidase subunit 2